MSQKLATYLSPLFTAVAGIATAAAAKYGLHLTTAEVVSAETTVAAAAGATVLKWLHDQRKFREFDAQLKVDVEEAARYAGVKFSPEEVEAKLQELIEQLAKHASGADEAEARVNAAEDAAAQAKASESQAREELEKLKGAVATAQTLAGLPSASQPATPLPTS